MEKDDDWTTIDDPPPGSWMSVAVRGNASVYMHLQRRDERVSARECARVDAFCSDVRVTDRASVHAIFNCMHGC